MTPKCGAPIFGCDMPIRCAEIGDCRLMLPRLPTTEAIGTPRGAKCRNNPDRACLGDERCAPPGCWLEDHWP